MKWKIFPWHRRATETQESRLSRSAHVLLAVLNTGNIPTHHGMKSTTNYRYATPQTCTQGVAACDLLTCSSTFTFLACCHLPVPVSSTQRHEQAQETITMIPVLELQHFIDLTTSRICIYVRRAGICFYAVMYSFHSSSSTHAVKWCLRSILVSIFPCYFFCLLVASHRLVLGPDSCFLSSRSLDSWWLYRRCLPSLASACCFTTTVFVSFRE